MTLPVREQLNTVPWWLRELNKRLNDQQDTLSDYEDYYAGVHRLQFATDKFRKVFGNLFSAFADNFCGLVVDAAEERLNVEGFHFGGETGDSDAWDLWQRNELDSGSQLAHTEALVVGHSFVMVDPDPPLDMPRPAITIESSRQCIVAYDSAYGTRRVAGLKRWTDDAGYGHANLFLPGVVLKYESQDKIGAISDAHGTRMYPSDNTVWLLTETAVNRLKAVPLVPLINKPRLGGYGESEMAQVIPQQDMLNKLLMDAVISSEFGSFRQRYAIGLDIDDEAALKAAANRLWSTPDKDVTFGEFGQNDMTGLIKMIETVIQHIASITRTPPHYLLGQAGSFPSGESLRATEVGLVAKVMRKQRYFGQSWEEVMRLAFRALGDPRADFVQAETIWRDAEYRAPGQWADALTKLKTLNVPDQGLWEEWGASPEKVNHWKQLREEQAQLAAEEAAAAPPPTLVLPEQLGSQPAPPPELP